MLIGPIERLESETCGIRIKLAFLVTVPRRPHVYPFHKIQSLYRLSTLAAASKAPDTVNKYTQRR